MNQVKPRVWHSTMLIGSEDKLHVMSTDQDFIDKVFWKEKFDVIEKSAFDTAVKFIKETKCNCRKTYWPGDDDNYTCRRCTTLKDLGCDNESR